MTRHVLLGMTPALAAAALLTAPARAINLERVARPHPTSAAAPARGDGDHYPAAAQKARWLNMFCESSRVTFAPRRPVELSYFTEGGEKRRFELRELYQLDHQAVRAIMREVARTKERVAPIGPDHERAWKYESMRMLCLMRWDIHDKMRGDASRDFGVSSNLSELAARAAEHARVRSQLLLKAESVQEALDALF